MSKEADAGTFFLNGGDKSIDLEIEKTPLLRR